MKLMCALRCDPAGGMRLLLPVVALAAAAFLLTLPAAAALANEGQPELERLGQPQLKVALLLTPSEAVPIDAQIDLFEQFASEQLDPRVVAARLRHVEESRVVYLELFTNPFRDRNAAQPEREELVEKGASLLSTWYDGLKALEQAARELRDAEPASLEPVLVRGLFDGDAVAEALATDEDDADEEAEPEEDEEADEPDAVDEAETEE